MPGGIARAFASRNYRLFFGGQLVSLIGTWMQSLATSWLAYQLTHSAFMLGAVGFCSQIATFAVTPFAGVWADRVDRRRTLVITQLLSMCQALSLAALTLSGRVQVWHLLCLGACLGLINAFDIPTRQSFVPQMLENPEDLPNAIALNSSMVNGARLLGPVVAGALVAWVGEGLCFLLNGLSYIAVIAALLAMRVQPREPGPRRAVLVELREGFSYLVGHRLIRALLLLVGLLSLMGQPYTVLLPIFATDYFHGGSSTLGMLTGATGVGALTGAMFLARRGRAAGLERMLPVTSMVFGIGLIAFGQAPALWVALPLLACVGSGWMLSMAACNTLIQTNVDEALRGRVLAFYVMAFMGMAPFGSLIAGTIAHRIGAPATVTFNGTALVLGAALFAWRLPRIQSAS